MTDEATIREIAETRTLKTSDAAELLGTRLGVVKRFIKEGRLVSVSNGRYHSFKESDVMALKNRLDNDDLVAAKVTCGCGRTLPHTERHFARMNGTLGKSCLECRYPTNHSAAEPEPAAKTTKTPTPRLSEIVAINAVSRILQIYGKGVAASLAHEDGWKDFAEVARVIELLGCKWYLEAVNLLTVFTEDRD